MSGGLVVVGSGPAGLAAARSFREAGGSGRVRLVSMDTDLPYDRPPLSKDFLRGQTDEADVLLEPASFYAEHEVETVLARAIGALDRGAKRLTVGGGETLDYDTLIIATGARPAPLPVPGGDDPAVMTLRSLAEARVLRAAASRAKRAVVVGSGFIGCEAALSLAARGVTVTLITKDELPHYSRLGPDAGARVEGWLRAAGVELLAGVNVASVQPHHDSPGIEVDEHGTISADLVLVAAGIRPQSGFAGDSGLVLERGRIRVDERLRTADPDVLAAGDVALAHNRSAGRPIATEHWDDADGQGALAGQTAAGVDVSWDSVPGFWSELGEHTLQYHGWGDGFDEANFVEHDDGAFTVWYGREGRTVGVLSSGTDEDYERGEQLIRDAEPVPNG